MAAPALKMGEHMQISLKGQARQMTGSVLHRSISSRAFIKHAAALKTALAESYQRRYGTGAHERGIHYTSYQAMPYPGGVPLQRVPSAGT